MFRPAEGFAHSETIVPPHRGFSPCETIYPSNGGIMPAEGLMPFHGGFAPADTHARFLDDIRDSHSCRHPRDYVEELMMTDPMTLHHLASLVAELLKQIKSSTPSNYGADRNCFAKAIAPSHTGASSGESGQQQNRRSSGRGAEKPQAKQSERQQPIEINRDTGNPSDKAAKLSSAGKQAAAEMNTVGKCATGVQNALAKAGMPEFKGKFHGWQAREVLLKSGKFEEVPLSQVREGDVVCRKTNSNLRDANAKYGHVAIIGKNQNGKLMEYSDHARAFAPNHPRYSQTVVLRLKPQYA
jgi:hypothetical protein